MHIAIEASTWINQRGYGRFTRELTRALLNQRGPHRFTLVLDASAAQAADLPDTPRVIVNTRRAVTEAAVSGGSRSPIDLWRMSRALSSRTFDVVLFPTLYSYTPVFSRARQVLVVHDALPERMPDMVLGSTRARWLWAAKSWLACRQASVVATVSAASADDVRVHLPVGRKPVVVLTEGAAPIFTAEAGPKDEDRVAAIVPAGCRFVLYVGGFSPHKRVVELVTAFGDLLAADAMGDVHLVLAGPLDDRFHSALDRVRAARDGLGDRSLRVVMPGFVPDETLAVLYRRATCVVLPSMLEGFGLPAVEAMACGAPLVVSATPALRELCGDAAQYISSMSDLPGAIGRLLYDADLRARCRAAGFARSTEVGWNRGAERLLAAIERLGHPSP